MVPLLTRCRLHHAALAILLTAHGALAQAQDRSAPSCLASNGVEQSSPIPVAITLSGGVSLGAYQAGFLYYAGLIFSENPQLFDTKIITGASAGGLNTLLATLSFCGREPASPARSALWNAWISLKAEDFVGKPDDPRALLPRKALLKIAGDIERVWFEGLPQSCDVVLGVSATRVTPARMNSTSDLNFARQEEKFSIRIHGRGPGKAPDVTNYVNALAGGGQPLLALEPGDDRQNFAAVRDLLLATSAFPFVFPPQTLHYCNVGESNRWLHADYPLTCRPDEIEQAEFLDGGLLDNKPLGLAERLARTGLRERQCSSHVWQQIPSLVTDPSGTSHETLFIYVDVGSLAYPDSDQSMAEKRFVPFAGGFLGKTFNSSRNKDSLVAVEQNPRLSDQVAPARNLYPRAGEHFIGFFGFFERDFRVFDFYLGMYEAREFFRTRVLPNLSQGGVKIGSKVRLPAGEDERQQDWKPFVCLSAVLEEKVPSRAGACKAFDSTNFVILAEVAKARLRAACEADPAAAARADSSCARLKPKSSDSPTRRSDEDDLQFTLRLLTSAGFEYKDLGLSTIEASIAPAKIKTGALNAIDALAAEQPISDRLMLQAGGPLALNLIDRLPTETESYLALGNKISIGTSWLQRSETYPPRARFALLGQLERYEAWLGSTGHKAVPSLLAGMEWELGDVGSTVAQSRVALLAGYKFNASKNDDGTERLSYCAAGSRATVDCGGVVVQPSLSVTFVERVRLQLDLETLPFHTGPLPWQFSPSVGLQFYF